MLLPYRQTDFLRREFNLFLDANTDIVAGPKMGFFHKAASCPDEPLLPP